MTMKCEETCARYNDLHAPCIGIIDGLACNLCENGAAQVYVVAQRTSPVPSYCEVKDSGFEESETTYTNCGYKLESTCKNQVCDPGNATKTNYKCSKPPDVLAQKSP